MVCLAKFPHPMALEEALRTEVSLGESYFQAKSLVRLLLSMKSKKQPLINNRSSIEILEIILGVKIPIIILSRASRSKGTIILMDFRSWCMRTKTVQ
jgi:hypothetical protein